MKPRFEPGFFNFTPMETQGHEKFMRRAIELAGQNVKQNLGGPFGAVIVKDGEIIAESANQVLAQNDPTAHAEVSAIRLACKKLSTYDLQGSIIYTSCEPCPMCLGAIYWAHIDAIYYGNTKKDAANIGFDDQFIYEELYLPLHERSLHIAQLLPEEAIAAFKLWETSNSKTGY